MTEREEPFKTFGPNGKTTKACELAAWAIDRVVIDGQVDKLGTVSSNKGLIGRINLTKFSVGILDIRPPEAFMSKGFWGALDTDDRTRVYDTHVVLAPPQVRPESTIRPSMRSLVRGLSPYGTDYEYRLAWDLIYRYVDTLTAACGGKSFSMNEARIFLREAGLSLNRDRYSALAYFLGKDHHVRHVDDNRMALVRSGKRVSPQTVFLLDLKQKVDDTVAKLIQNGYQKIGHQTLLCALEQAGTPVHPSQFTELGAYARLANDRQAGRHTYVADMDE